MSKFDEKLEIYTSEFKNTIKMKIDEDLLRKVTKGLGPSIYKEDASKVSCSDKSELDRVKANFLLKKLGLEDSPKLDEAIKEVCAEMGSSNRKKFRAMFYYMLVKKLKQESFYE
ncbi:MAG TPA: DUF2853 family protein [Saprospiraceae bacterium]|nr:DUF2853 family protein [Saprospiraceae bacterium]